MPPATTRRFPERPTHTSRDARIVPPFVPTPSTPRPDAAVPVELDQPVVAAEPEAAQPEAVHAEAAQPEPVEIEAPEPVEEQGTVEPAFEADTDAVLHEITKHAAELSQRAEFPLEAFIVPEQAQHVPSGLEGVAVTAGPAITPVSSLAERLEKLSHRLRVEDSDAIVRRLAAGDRLDALLAGLLAGYLAGKSEQQ